MDGRLTYTIPGEVIQLVDQATWDTLMRDGKLSCAWDQGGYLIGRRPEGLPVAVRIYREETEIRCIDVPDADTKEAFLKHAEQAWREKHKEKDGE